MAHAEWCGKPCCECENPCRLDAILPCSPDCENLGQDGFPAEESCKGCDAYEEFKIMMDDEADYEPEDEELSDGEQACELIDKIYQIICKQNIDKDVKDKLKEMLYEVTTHLDM